MPFIISSARFPEDLDDIQRLLTEYATWLGIDLSFQNWHHEFALLPGKYAQPDGDFLIARSKAAGEAVGCVAVRKIDLNLDATASSESGKKYCEMKRLWVADTARGTGAGAALITASMRRASEMGYDYMVLDTLKHRMRSAVKLYERLGFLPRAKYCENPFEDVIYFQLDLKNENLLPPLPQSRELP
jgi:ribosomal protein S18 acetylase RimI-like enzyme